MELAELLLELSKELHRADSLTLDQWDRLSAQYTSEVAR